MTTVLGHCHVCCEEEATRHYDRGELFVRWTRKPRVIPVCETCFVGLGLDPEPESSEAGQWRVAGDREVRPR